MSYKLIIERKAEKDAAKIPHHLRASIDKAILALAQNPQPRGCKKLTDKEGYRIRMAIIASFTRQTTKRKLLLSIE